jgi:imidazolonepropionase-like amidohydrolase
MVGHADREYVTAPGAWKAKQQIEHLDGYMEQILRDDAPMKGSVSDLYMSNPKNWESIDFIDEAKIAIVAKKSVEANPFSDPTQHFFKNTFALPRSEESIRAQPDFKFYPKKVQDQWLNWYKRSRLITEVSAERKMKWIDARNKLIKAIHDNGGKLMTGSDTPEFLWLYGFGLHHELKALRDAGIGNYAALAAGTRNPHEFLGSLSKAGTVEKGKRGDLILLNKNPLDDIAATYDRAGVMLKGKYYTQTELNGWLDEIAPKIAGSHIEPKPAAGQ